MANPTQPDQPIEPNRSAFASYVLRCWLESSGGVRLMLIRAETGQKFFPAGYEELTGLLRLLNDETLSASRKDDPK